VLLPGVGDGRAVEDRGEDGVLAGGDLRGEVGHLGEAVPGHHDHAVVVADHDVAGADLRVAERDWDLRVGDLDAVLAGAHEPAVAVHGVAEAQRGRGQPATPFVINPDGAYSIGLQIDQNMMVAVVVDLSGKIRGLTNTMPLHVEILYNEYAFTAAFAVASLLALLALVTLAVKTVLEWRYGDQIAGTNGH